MKAAPVVGAILGKRLDWSADHTVAAVRKYVEKIERYLHLAGLTS
jgi:hypothetical protein